MAKLAELNLYPIKSCGGVNLNDAVLTNAGLRLADDTVGDREWMLVDAHGQFLTQRTHPRMTLITPLLHADHMELHAPDMLPLKVTLESSEKDHSRTIDVRVWRDTLPALDCGDEAATWMSELMSAPCRLVRFDQSSTRIASPKRTGDIVVPMLFNDSFPLLVIGKASLDDLNRRLLKAGREELPMNRFRPNLVIDDIEPYEEDHSQLLTIGNTAIRLVRPCQRCPVPSIDQATGIPGPDPQDILRTYRAEPSMNGAIVFGMHAIVEAGAGSLLRVGQKIEIVATH